MSFTMHMASIIPTDRATAGSEGGERERTAVLRASFERQGEATRLAGRYHTAPIKIAKTFPLDDTLGVMVMDVSPGMLSGDRYEMDWDVGAGASVYATNQSFTRVHPCAQGTRAALRQRYRLGPDAVAESLMEPVMLYRDAEYEADTTVHLAEGSLWMGAEVLCPGRMLRGESFRYRRLDNRLRVYRGGELIYHQRQLVEPAVQRLNAPGAWESFSHTGAFHAFGDRVGAPLLEAVREALAALPVRADRPVLAGASLTYRHGLAVMAAGGAAWTVREALYAAWTAARAALLGRGPLLFNRM